MRNDHLIEDFLDSFAPAWAAMDFRTFTDTVDVLFYDPLIAEPWTRLHTIPMMDRVKGKNMTPHQGALLLGNPSAIRCIFYYDLFMAQCARFGLPTYERIFNFYSDILHALCPEDPFAKTKQNRIHNDREVAEMISGLEPATPDIARKLGKLANACYNLSYGLYSDMNPQLTYDNIGPYPQKDGRILPAVVGATSSSWRMFAVKIFRNLKPLELWPETEKIPVDTIEIWALFEGVDLEVDSVTHAVYKGDQINGLRGWSCHTDGKALTIEEVEASRKIIEQVAIDIFARVKSLDLEAKKDLYWKQKAWSYKKLFDVLGLDWMPHEEVLASGRGKALFDNWAIPEAKTAQVKFLREVFDPRTEIPPHCFQKA
jgi:hypothetical protein